MDSSTKRLASPAPVISELEMTMVAAGWVNVQALDSTIRVDLKYASKDNFLGENLYGDLSKCYLIYEAAKMLVQAQANLKGMKPGYSLLVFDGGRPRSVQRKMWKIVEGTEKERYVAEPAHGSVHNYGGAIDLTIVDGAGQEIDMGTEYDHFGREAQPRYHQELLDSGKITQQQIDNRNLLKHVMKEAGFQPILTEWWHFNAFSKEYVRGNYTMIE